MSCPIFFHNSQFNSQSFSEKVKLCFSKLIKLSYILTWKWLFLLYLLLAFVICLKVDETRGPQYVTSFLYLSPIYLSISQPTFFFFYKLDRNIYFSISKSICIHYKQSAPYKQIFKWFHLFQIRLYFYCFLILNDFFILNSGFTNLQASIVTLTIHILSILDPFHYFKNS